MFPVPMIMPIVIINIRPQPITAANRYPAISATDDSIFGRLEEAMGSHIAAAILRVIIVHAI